MAAMEPNPQEPHKAVSLVERFTTLHVKLPTETFRQPAPDDGEPGQKVSDVWLDGHPRGFLLMHNLHAFQPMGKCMLVKSIDTGQLLVVKRLKRYAPRFTKDWWKKDPAYKFPHKITYETVSPPELRFSTLADPNTQHLLPDEGYFPKLYAYGIPGGAKAFNRDGECDLFSLYFKRYNGGTLENLLFMYGQRDTGAPVPEPFIWHVIAQLCRAVVFLQTGCTWEAIRRGVSPPQANWKPIVHRNIVDSNILLNFPEAGDKDKDALGFCFPEVILEGFDAANRVDDGALFWGNGAVNRWRAEQGLDRAGPGLWEDMHMIGVIFRRLVMVYDLWRVNQTLGFDVDHDGKLEWYLHENLDLEEGEEPPYSDALIDLLKAWEIEALQTHAGWHFWDERPGVRDQIPTVDWLIKVVLPMADAKVSEFHERGRGREHEGEALVMWDVSWVIPDHAFETVPYSGREATDGDILREFERDLRWLFGPYIPMRYSYAHLFITPVNPRAGVIYKYYSRYHRRIIVLPVTKASGGKDAEGGDAGDGKSEVEDEGGGREGEGEDEDGDGEVEEGNEDGRDEDERGEDAEMGGGDIEGEGEGDQDPDAENPDKAAYVAWIRQFQNSSLGNQQLEVVFVTKPPTTKKGRPRKTKKLDPQSLRRQADLERDYHQMMDPKRKELLAKITDPKAGLDLWEKHDDEDDDEDGSASGPTRTCGCSNCVRKINQWILKKRNTYNADLKKHHLQTLDRLKPRPEFNSHGKNLTYPDFDPLLPDPPLIQPQNPFNPDSGVENWAHNPFDEEDYKERWRPSRAYPWRQWDYATARRLLPSPPGPIPGKKAKPKAAKPPPRPRPTKKRKRPDAAYKDRPGPGGEDGDDGSDHDDDGGDGPPPPKLPRRSARVAARQQQQQQQALAQAQAGQAPPPPLPPPRPRPQPNPGPKAPGKGQKGGKGVWPLPGGGIGNMSAVGSGSGSGSGSVQGQGAGDAAGPAQDKGNGKERGKGKDKDGAAAEGGEGGSVSQAEAKRRARRAQDLARTEMLRRFRQHFGHDLLDDPRFQLDEDLDEKEWEDEQPWNDDKGDEKW